MYTPVPANVSEKSVRAGKLLVGSYTVCASSTHFRSRDDKKSNALYIHTCCILYLRNAKTKLRYRSHPRPTTP